MISKRDESKKLKITAHGDGGGWIKICLKNFLSHIYILVQDIYLNLLLLFYLFFSTTMGIPCVDRVNRNEKKKHLGKNLPRTNIKIKVFAVRVYCNIGPTNKLECIGTQCTFNIIKCCDINLVKFVLPQSELFYRDKSLPVRLNTFSVIVCSSSAKPSARPHTILHRT